MVPQHFFTYEFYISKRSTSHDKIIGDTCRHPLRIHFGIKIGTWGTWHVVTHVEETHTESHKKIWVDSVNGSHRNCTLKLLLSCSWASGDRQANKPTNKHPKRLVERERLAARSLKIWADSVVRTQINSTDYIRHFHLENKCFLLSSDILTLSNTNKGSAL